MSRIPRKSAHAPRGFTLVELVVVITIIAILAGAIVPTIVKPFMHERRTETIREMEAIEEAILGRPDLGDWGYLSTIGQLPTSIASLLERPGSWTAGSFRNGVPRGWNGPYIQIATQDPTRDAWGELYLVVTNPSDPLLWQVQSWGPNRVAGPAGPTNDDIFFPSPTGWYGSTGTVQITLVTARGNSTAVIDPTWVTSASLHVPINNGASDDPKNCALSQGQCTLSNIPIGLHTLQIDQSPGTGCTVGVDCTIFRPIKVTKPTNTVEVVLPSPTASSDITCDLATMAAASGLASGAQCPGSAYVPPGGRLTVTVTGALSRTSGTNRCMVAAQILNTATSARLPLSDPGSVVLAGSLPVTLISSGPAPTYTSRTFFNNTTTAITVRPGAVIAADGSTNCQFTDGKVVAHRWGTP